MNLKTEKGSDSPYSSSDEEIFLDQESEDDVDYETLKSLLLARNQETKAKLSQLQEVLSHLERTLEDRCQVESKRDMTDSDDVETELRQIKVRTLTGSSTSLEVKPTDTVEEVKSKIWREKGISPTQQKLFVAGRLLKNEKTLGDYCVKNNSVVILYVCLGTQICTGTITGERTPLAVNQEDTIEVGKQKLPSTIGSMEIFAKTLTGKHIAIEVEQTDTIESVKTVLQDREGIPIDQQRLIFRGRECENYLSLQDCGIEHGGVIHLCLRMRG